MDNLKVFEYDSTKLGFSIIDPKGSLWLGLEDIVDGKLPVVVRVKLNKPYTIEQAKEKIDWVCDLRVKRETERTRLKKKGEYKEPPPHYLIIDEWFLMLKTAKKYDRIQNENPDEDTGKSNIHDDIIDCIDELLYSGREDKIFVWIIAQTHFAKILKIDSGTRDQFSIVAQGRKGKYESIEKVLMDRFVISRNDDRKELAKKFGELVKDNKNNFPIVYTNLGGHQICFQENLPDLQGKILFRAKNVNQNGNTKQTTPTTIFPTINESDLW